MQTRVHNRQRYTAWGRGKPATPMQTLTLADLRSLVPAKDGTEVERTPVSHLTHEQQLQLK